MRHSITPTTKELWRQFSDELRRFILKHVQDLDTAEDILQDVFVKIHLHIDSLRESDRLQSWIYQITRNAITDYYRRVRPQDELPKSLASPLDEEPDAFAELTASVKGMLNCLPEKYRQALELTEFQGFSQVELATRLNISVSGAKSRVQRAREKLKEAFLDCCHFEFDRLGRVIHYEPKCSHCAKNSSNRKEDCDS